MYWWRLISVDLDHFIMLDGWVICLLLTLKDFPWVGLELVHVLSRCAHFGFCEVSFVSIGSVSLCSFLLDLLLAPACRRDGLDWGTVSETALGFAFLVGVQPRAYFGLGLEVRTFRVAASSPLVELNHVWADVQSFFWAFVSWSFLHAFLHWLHRHKAACRSWVFGYRACKLSLINLSLGRNSHGSNVLLRDWSLDEVDLWLDERLVHLRLTVLQLHLITFLLESVHLPSVVRLHLIYFADEIIYFALKMTGSFLLLYVESLQCPDLCVFSLCTLAVLFSVFCILTEESFLHLKFHVFNLLVLCFYVQFQLLLNSDEHADVCLKLLNHLLIFWLHRALLRLFNLVLHS